MTEPPAPSRPLTIGELSNAYRSGSASPVDKTKEYLRRIEALNPILNCFITVLADSALEAASQSELRFRAGKPLGPLDGVPVAVKDLIYIEGVRCTAGSKILENNKAGYDAPVVGKLKAAGAIIIGTTNLHEFGSGVTNVNPHYGAVKNPWAEGRVAGGSSGGSAASVAAGMVPASLGTDTGGSARIPAALCGVVGLKPTYGRVSRLGVVPLASSLDTVGVLSSCAWDAAAVLQVIAGHDREDMTTVDAEVPNFIEGLGRRFPGARVGAVLDYFLEDVVPEVEKNFTGFVSKLKEIGCSVEKAELDGISEVYDRWLPIRRAEATAFHLRWLESSPELYGDDVRKLLELGKAIPAVDYVNALNARPSLMERFSASMKNFDFLVLPSTCVPAPEVRQSKLSIRGKEMDVYSALNRLTLPFNYVGFPVASVPSGLVGGLPLGVQIVGKLFDEAGVLRLVGAYEKKFGPYPFPRIPDER